MLLALERPDVFPPLKLETSQAPTHTSDSIGCIWLVLFPGETTVIWELLRALHCPDEYAVTVKNGEVHAARIEDLEAQGLTVIDRSKRGNVRQAPERHRR